MKIKNVSGQTIPYMVYGPDGKHFQRIIRKGLTFEISEDEITPDVLGKIRKKIFKVVG